MGVFYFFLYCTDETKSRKASHMHCIQMIILDRLSPLPLIKNINETVAFLYSMGFNYFYV